MARTRKTDTKEVTNPGPIFTQEELSVLLEMSKSFIECDHETTDFRTIFRVGVEDYGFSEEEILDAHESLGRNIRIYFKLRRQYQELVREDLLNGTGALND